jgi:4-diphosphocytidyl-2-C-methyl-D-erythritol kinase
LNVSEIKSIAKINLGLLVKEKRKDGFHNLETIFYPLNDIFDTLRFEKNERTLFNSNINFPFDENNLIWKAKNAIEKITGIELNVKIDLTKRIPMGGGLGGGSSNAAFTLIALNKMFELNLDKETLNEIALQLGSDVPYFLYSKPAFAESRGEILTPVELKLNGYLVLVNPNIHISTKEAFANISPAPADNLNVNEIIKSINAGYGKADKVIRNVFEPYVFNKYPVIKEIKETALEQGAMFSGMSGTGSTIFSIFDSKEKAVNFATAFKMKNFVVLISEDHG